MGPPYESFGEDPALVEATETIIQGLQGSRSGKDLHRSDKVLGSAKHFVGDGGTGYGSSTTGTYTTDQGVTEVTRQELEAVHLSPYEESVKRGVGTVMPSYSSLDMIGDGQGPVKMHASAEMINGVLKDGLGFDGFVVSDWKAIDQIPGDYPRDVRTSVNAGRRHGHGPRRRTRTSPDARRLRSRRAGSARPASTTRSPASSPQKFRLGLFEKPYADTSGASARIGSAGHRAVAREAVAEVAGAAEERRGRSCR
ncbi:hypothetical protein SBADM41S_09326 [Streptomyces badius]